MSLLHQVWSMDQCLSHTFLLLSVKSWVCKNWGCLETFISIWQSNNKNWGCILYVFLCVSFPQWSFFVVFYTVSVHSGRGHGRWNKLVLHYGKFENRLSNVHAPLWSLEWVSILEAHSDPIHIRGSNNKCPLSLWNLIEEKGTPRLTLTLLCSRVFFPMLTCFLFTVLGKNLLCLSFAYGHFNRLNIPEHSPILAIGTFYY